MADAPLLRRGRRRPAAMRRFARGVRALREPLRVLVAGVLAAGSGACSPDPEPPETPVEEPPGTVTLYTDRLDAPLRTVLGAFRGRTDADVEVVVAPAADLLARLAREGAADAPHADLVLVDDARVLAAPGASDLLEAVETDALEDAVPALLRDPEGRWWGVAQRARVLGYRCADAEDDSEADEPPSDPAGDTADDPAGDTAAAPPPAASLAALADSAWAGRVLVGDAGPTTPVALVADVVARRGETTAEAWAAGLAAALARPPQGDDAAQLAALRSGEGDLAVVESRTVARAPATGEAGVCVHFPDQEGDGAPMTLAAAALVADAPQRELALRLLEHLVSEEAQTVLAWTGHEYPVREGVPWSPTLLAWGGFRADTIGPVASYAALQVAEEILLRIEASPDTLVSPGSGPAGAEGPAPPDRPPPPGTARPPAR